MQDSERDGFIVWKDEYSVQFRIIDEQHRGLVAMTNDLLKGCKAGGNSRDAVFMETVRKAVEYAQVHFYTEEKYMKQAAYPELEQHKGEHAAFVSKVQETVAAFEQGKADPFDLAIFLKEWLLSHIAVSDKKYAPYLAALPQ
ncbi:MAG: bacteriohemerythrin [Treponema sp.]|jgi:hemerythrin|nr:bacteriohemerythrin [Treponema sp.]